MTGHSVVRVAGKAIWVDEAWNSMTVESSKQRLVGRGAITSVTAHENTGT